MTAELDAAIFDLGGVLTTSVLESFSVFERELGVPEGSLVRAFGRAASGGEPDFHLLETGRLTEAEYYRRLGIHLRDVTGIEVTLPEDPGAVRRALWGSLRPNEEMIEAVRGIARHYPVGLLTNNVREWGRWRGIYPVELFRVVVDSSDVGMRKPDAEIFRLVCERLGVLPERAAFVDDIPANVDGASAVGLKAILFTTTGEVLARLRPLFPKAFA
jgi:putative hydrolase of the HAD superfamily